MTSGVVETKCPEICPCLNGSDMGSVVQQKKYKILFVCSHIVRINFKHIAQIKLIHDMFYSKVSNQLIGTVLNVRHLPCIYTTAGALSILSD